PRARDDRDGSARHLAGQRRRQPAGRPGARLSRRAGIVMRDREARTSDRKAVAAWLLFDFAAQPFYTLILTFVFAPYFAARLAADPVEGQALWGFAAGAAGLIVALLAPMLGAVADA